jgi:hypothetical protein
VSGPALLRLTALPAHDDLPVLIGSTLHASMGAAEIAGLAALPTLLTITLADAGALAGTLHVYSTAPLLLERAEGCTVPAVASTAPHVWAVAIACRQRGARQVISLRRGETTARRTSPLGA